jgi:hypothetical protein
MARSSESRRTSRPRALSAKAASAGGRGASASSGRSRKSDSNPWLFDAGIFKDDPTFLDMMKEIYRDRAGEYTED